MEDVGKKTENFSKSPQFRVVVSDIFRGEPKLSLSGAPTKGKLNENPGDRNTCVVNRRNRSQLQNPPLWEYFETTNPGLLSQEQSSGASIQIPWPELQTE